MGDEGSCCGAAKKKDGDFWVGRDRGGCWTSTGDMGSTFREIQICSGELEDN